MINKYIHIYVLLIDLVFLYYLIKAVFYQNVVVVVADDDAAADDDFHFLPYLDK